MMQPEDALLVVVMFLAVLLLATVLLNVALDTPAHKDARRRRDLGDKWWHA
jgi:hypothetical protein